MMSCGAKRRWSRVALLSGIFLIACVMTIGGKHMWNNVEKNEHVGGFEAFDQARELRGHYTLSTLRFESEFVIEWVNYHLWIGFSHMVIYDEDNTATSELAKLLAHYISEGVVTLIEWPAGEQSQAYRHGLRTFGQHATSLTFLDGDEYIVLCKQATVHDAYKAAGLFKSPRACLEMPWVLFGPWVTTPSAENSTSVSERLTLRARKPFAKHPGKTVLRGGRDFRHTRLYGRGVSPIWHWCRNGRPEIESISVDAKHIRVNHYQFRHGADSVKKKQERGNTASTRRREYSKMHLKELPWMRDAIEDYALANLTNDLPTLHQPRYSAVYSPRVSPTECCLI